MDRICFGSGGPPGARRARRVALRATDAIINGMARTFVYVVGRGWLSTTFVRLRDDESARVLHVDESKEPLRSKSKGALQYINKTNHFVVFGCNTVSGIIMFSFHASLPKMTFLQF